MQKKALRQLEVCSVETSMLNLESYRPKHLDGPVAGIGLKLSHDLGLGPDSVFFPMQDVTEEEDVVKKPCKIDILVLHQQDFDFFSAIGTEVCAVVRQECAPLLVLLRMKCLVGVRHLFFHHRVPRVPGPAALRVLLCVVSDANCDSSLIYYKHDTRNHETTKPRNHETTKLPRCYKGHANP